MASLKSRSNGETRGLKMTFFDFALVVTTAAWFGTLITTQDQRAVSLATLTVVVTAIAAISVG